ncbi:SRPBCC family protein [Chloroflexus sp.]|uniref:SRPBCC family protein n=1 Tax=Chloroflexus sp. TaxID=1904827 RepID=UPI00298F0300|nr:SRPBCC family protein [Chloroflexus sp.]MCX7858601.1 SRPBCC family protein [Chloroflexus sp.]MDW8404557.1 SRPBCC family protein [Chloroflexus sp.]
MIVQEQFVAIKAPPATVERYLTDPELMAQWRSPLVVLDPIEGDLMALGSKHKLRLKSLALAGATYTVTERDSGHILLTIDGLWRGTELWRWFADGDRTVVQNRVEYEVPDPSLRVFVVGLGQIFASLDMRIQLDRLRMIIEGSGQPAAARSR